MVALAHTPPAPPHDGHGGPAKMHDCSKMDDADKKARCEERHKAMKAAMDKCKDTKGDDHRKCMRDNMPQPPEKK